MRPSKVFSGVVLAGCTALAGAQSKPLLPAPDHSGLHVQVVEAPDFGSTVVWQRITAAEFDPDTSGTTYSSTWNPPGALYYGRYVTGGFPHLVASPHLPGGARVRSIRFEYCDMNGPGHLGINLYDCDQSGCNPVPVRAFDSSAFPVCFASYTVQGLIDHTVNNVSHQLLIDVVFGAVDGTNQLASVSLGYELQVSPAPASATFGDVPTSSPQFQFVEALVAAGITAGCGSGNYCPGNPVTRGQMAVFLAKALGLNWAQ